MVFVLLVLVIPYFSSGRGFRYVPPRKHSNLAEDDCEQASELNQKLKSELNSYAPCPVMDYVKQTAKTQDVKRTVAEMHRKVDINQLMKKTYIKQLKSLNSGYLHQ